MLYAEGNNTLLLPSLLCYHNTEGYVIIIRKMWNYILQRGLKAVVPFLRVKIDPMVTRPRHLPQGHKAPIFPRGKNILI